LSDEILPSVQSVPLLLNELIINMKGLRKEVEAWRVHTSSGGEFILGVLDSQIGVIEELKAGLK
jgi:hypothetical protein